MEINNFYIIVIASILATSAMTAFSYAVSASFRDLYKEPVLLSYLLSELQINISPEKKNILGWILHYVIGVIFVLIYHFMWKHNILDLSWPVSILLGTISGFLGIISWFFMFKFTHFTPNIDFKGYYLQLLLAHIIFGIVAFMVYKYFKT